MIRDLFTALSQQQQSTPTAVELFQSTSPPALEGEQFLQAVRGGLFQQRESQNSQFNSPQDLDIQDPMQIDPIEDDASPIEIFNPGSGSSSLASSGEVNSFVDFTFNREARRDKNGNLRVYRPPKGDGGGAFEVAGITAKFQPEESRRLKALIESGNHKQAEIEAKKFFEKRAQPFVKHTKNEGLKLQLADTVHHRGEGGLRKILQRATGKKSSNASLISALSNDPNGLNKFHNARQRYEWEEVDRGRESRKKFRQGLQNRFNQAHQAALKLQG